MHSLKEIKSLFLFCCLLLLCTACNQNTFDTKEQLLTFLQNEENGFVHTKSVNGVNYKLLYKPTDLMVSQEMNDQWTPTDIDSLRNKYKEYIYFNLSISKNNKELLSNISGDRQTYGTMVNNLAFGMRENVHLFNTKRDTIPMLDYVYPRMYGMSPSTSMLLVYPKNEYLVGETITLTIEDLGFGTGEVRFSQKIDPILNEPQLKFTK